MYDSVHQIAGLTKMSSAKGTAQRRALTTYILDDGSGHGLRFRHQNDAALAEKMVSLASKFGDDLWLGQSELSRQKAVKIVEVPLHNGAELKLWRERARQDKRTPFEWTRDHFGDKPVDLATINIVDPQLYHALMRAISRKGQPSWFKTTLHREETIRPSKGAAAVHKRSQMHADLPEAAFDEIREALVDLRSQLSNAKISNAAKSEIESDVAQITIETERPSPRRSILKTFLESLRDNLVKIASGAVAAGIATLIGILAKYFGMF
jgi:hypothetical protein